MRDWNKMKNDELISIWKNYELSHCNNFDPLRHSCIQPKSIRITYFEIHNLVNELIERLEIKYPEL